MDRLKLLRMLVLNEVGDDYENFRKINSEVTSACSKAGFDVRPIEIAQALIELMENDAIKPYWLFPTAEPAEVQWQKSLTESQNCYFLQTRKGREIHTSNVEAWPLDDNGQLLGVAGPTKRNDSDK